MPFRPLFSELAPDAGLGNCGDVEPVPIRTFSDIAPTASEAKDRETSSSTLPWDPAALEPLEIGTAVSPPDAGEQARGRDGSEGCAGCVAPWCKGVKEPIVGPEANGVASRGRGDGCGGWEGGDDGRGGRLEEIGTDIFLEVLLTGSRPSTPQGGAATARDGKGPMVSPAVAANNELPVGRCEDGTEWKASNA